MNQIVSVLKLKHFQQGHHFLLAQEIKEHLLNRITKEDLLALESTKSAQMS